MGLILLENITLLFLKITKLQDIIQYAKAFTLTSINTILNDSIIFYKENLALKALIRLKIYPTRDQTQSNCS